MFSIRPIVVVGSINLDLVASAPCIPRSGETLSGTAFELHPGGKGANQAVAAARLRGPESPPVHLIARLGDDIFASQLRQSLSDSGVEHSAVLAVAGPSGVAAITVTPSGENSIVVVPGANAALTPAALDLHLDLLRSAAIVLTQLEIPLETVQHLAAICTRERIPLILDPAPACCLPPELLAQVTWFTPNETEAAFYAGSKTSTLAESLLELGPRNVILKQGAAGATLAAHGSTPRQIASFAVNAVDTTAAGDCFNAAFASALLAGNSAAEAVRFANAAAALSVTRAGAQPSMPSRAEVLDLMSCSPPDPEL